MSSEAAAIATPTPIDLPTLASQISTLASQIQSLKSSSEPDGDAVAAAVAALLDAKRTYARGNGGIGVDGNKWEEPLSKKEKKRVEKKKERGAAAVEGNRVSDANGENLCDDDDDSLFDC